MSYRKSHLCQVILGGPEDEKPEDIAASIAVKLNALADEGWTLVAVSGTFHYFTRG